MLSGSDTTWSVWTMHGSPCLQVSVFPRHLRCMTAFRRTKCQGFDSLCSVSLPSPVVFLSNGGRGGGADAEELKRKKGVAIGGRATGSGRIERIGA